MVRNNVIRSAHQASWSYGGMKKFIAVIGPARSGKSTLIQSLTGCHSHSARRLVIDRATERQIWVVANSPQEAPLNRRWFVRIVDEVASRPSILGLVVAIQPTRPTTRLSMEVIFQIVEETRSFSKFAFLLDPPYRGRQSRSLRAEVQERLRNFRVRVRILDGRRFALINASEIRRQSRIL